MKQLKRYQEKALNKLITRTKELFEEKKEKATMVFQSPTGSGKTFMMSKYIEQMIKEFENEELCFLWVSIGAGKLHEQSYYSLKKNFMGFPDVYLLEDEFHGGRSSIARNEVVIVNWDKLNQKDRAGDWKNVLMKDSERYNFRDVVENTTKLGIKIIMIIDESHTSSTSNRAMELRDDIIKPFLTIEMSATPIINDYDDKVSVNSDDVIEEGMIKKEIIINEDIERFNLDDITSEELILKTAYSKRFYLARKYEEYELDINPLCLIQVATGESGAQKIEFIESFLAKNGVTYENGKLAIWLSDDKINLEMLHDNENRVEFLIFKHAIATGWDCPRAQVLVKFREKGSEILEIQTVGRILRMPEGEHYNDDILNKAYMYINTNEFDVKKEEYNPNIIKSIYSTRKEIYKELKLRSYYLNRIDYGDITSNVYGDFEKVFCNFFGLEVGEYDFFDGNKKVLGKRVDLEYLDNRVEIIDNKHLSTQFFDMLNHEKIKSESSQKVKLSSADLDVALENMIKANLNGFAPKRSVSIMSNGIRRWFKQYLGINPRENNGYVKIRNIILSNYDIFARLLNDVTKTYKITKESEIAQKTEEVEEWNYEWEVPYKKAFNPQTYQKYNYKLSLYEPCYLSFDSEIEREFVEYLEKNSDNILWWWQNGSEHMALNFGLKYNTKSTFQPDFLVMFEDGRLGVFDTKASGYQEDDNKKKSEALQEYIKEENKNGKNLFGGLVIKEGEHFLINHKSEYRSFKDSFEDWEYFDC
jgi:type III restriction enzyme